MLYNMKSVLSANTAASQTIVANGYVSFEKNNVLTGCSIRHSAGSNVIELIKPGIYEIVVNADFSPSAAGDVAIKLMNNDVEVNGAVSTVTGAVGDTYTAMFSSIVRVLPSCPAVQNRAALQVQVSASATVSNANVTVVKLA